MMLQLNPSVICANLIPLLPNWKAPLGGMSGQSW
jgi:hypothetical protein